MIRIKSDGATTKVYKDGTEIRGIKEVSFSHNALDDRAEVRILLADDNVEIDADVIPELPEFYKSFYVKKNEPTQSPFNDVIDSF